jgi:hypothetical protein
MASMAWLNITTPMHDCPNFESQVNKLVVFEMILELKMYQLIGMAKLFDGEKSNGENYFFLHKTAKEVSITLLNISTSLFQIFITLNLGKRVGRFWQKASHFWKKDSNIKSIRTG